jgi:hypothetical protein
MKFLIPLLASVLLSTNTFAEDIHPEVLSALDWALPSHDCVPPKIKASHDSTSSTERKYKKAKKKFEKCYDGYKANLIEQQQNMMEVAKHGLTQEQAEIIMGNMKLIQSIVTSNFTQPTTLLIEVPYVDMDIPITHH